MQRCTPDSQGASRPAPPGTHFLGTWTEGPLWGLPFPCSDTCVPVTFAPGPAAPPVTLPEGSSVRKVARGSGAAPELAGRRRLRGARGVLGLRHASPPPSAARPPPPHAAVGPRSAADGTRGRPRLVSGLLRAAGACAPGCRGCGRAARPLRGVFGS